MASLGSFKFSWPARKADSAFLGGDQGGSPVSRLPVVGRLPLEQQIGVLLGGFFLFLILGVLIAWSTSQRTQNVDAFVNVGTRIEFLSQRIAKGAEQAAFGDPAAFGELKQAADEFNGALSSLADGGTFEGRTIPAADSSVQPALQNLRKTWELAQKNVGRILAARDDLVGLQRNVARIGQSSNELSALAEEFSGLLLQAGAATGQIAQANRLAFLAQRLARGANQILAARSVDPETAFLFSKDTETFRDIVDAFRSGNPALDVVAVKDREARLKVDELSNAFAKLQGSAAEVSQKIQRVAEAKGATAALYGQSETLLDGAGKSVKTLREGRGGERLWILSLIAFLIALGCLYLTWDLYLRDARRRAESSEREMKRNQEAILRLLNEMGDLADGDLTVRAQVTEDITGAIADSMNYTVEELRNLVMGVNNATTQVAEKTQEARKVSNELLEATRRQSTEIEDTTQQVLEVAKSITTVSASAGESANVAKRSLQAAEQGHQAVQNAIHGMQDMREQIQETAKRIKRLGESSQLIGEIVELIGDITEQTNVLALNAAIQAAAAGDAGRGFSVVAEEVQRLAERSTGATKQISAIVRTIQADTHDAAAAMERSIQGVVANTKLSDNAGQALVEIGNVSRQLADLIQSISHTTEAQVNATERVAKNMNDILHITRQTSDGTQRTAASVTQLAELAQELRNSVSGFKLQ